LAILPLVMADHDRHDGFVDVLTTVAALVILALLAWFYGVDSRPSADDRRPWWPGRPASGPRG
jgi:hypothetical protein